MNDEEILTLDELMNDGEGGDTEKQKLVIVNALRDYERARYHIKISTLVMESARAKLMELNVPSSIFQSCDEVNREFSQTDASVYSVVHHLNMSQTEIIHGQTACMPIAILFAYSALYDPIETYDDEKQFVDIMKAGAVLWKSWRDQTGTKATYALFSEIIDSRYARELKSTTVTREITGFLVSEVNEIANKKEPVTNRWTDRQYSVEEALLDFESASTPTSAVFTCREITLALWRRTMYETWAFDSHTCGNNGLSYDSTTANIGQVTAGAVLIRMKRQNSVLKYIMDRFPVSGEQRRLPQEHTFSLKYTINIMQRVKY